MCKNGRLRQTQASIRARLFGGRASVHVDFHTHRHLDDFWSLPSHFNYPSRTERQIAVGGKDKATPQTAQRAFCTPRAYRSMTRYDKAMVIGDWLSLFARNRHLSLHLVWVDRDRAPTVGMRIDIDRKISQPTSTRWLSSARCFHSQQRYKLLLLLIVF